MPNYGTPPEGGSGLGDFLAGFVGTYGQSAAQREEQRLAREREQRYADQLAWERDQRDRENARQEELDRAAAAERGLRGILKDTAPGIDRSATVAVRSGPGGGDASVTPLGGGEPTSHTTIGAGEFLEPRYRDTGSGYVIDRSIADPGVIAHRQQREADDRNANAIRGLAMLLGQDAGDLSVLAGTGISPDAAYRIGEGRAEDARARRGLETLASRYGVDPAGLDTASLRSEIDSKRGISEERSRLELANRYRRPSFQFLTDPTTGSVTAIDTSNPNHRVSVSDGAGTLDPGSPTLGFPPTAYLKSTISERQAAGRGNRVAAGLQLLQSMPMPEGLQAVIARSRGKSSETLRGAITTWIKNTSATPQAERYAQTLLAVAEPALRDATGAVVNEDELPRILNLLGAWPGASRETRADVYRQQDDILAGLVLNAGRAVTAPMAAALRNEALALLDPRKYVVRRKNQLVLAGYDEDEAARLAAQETMQRFPQQER